MRFFSFQALRNLKRVVMASVASGGLLAAGMQPAEAIIPVVTISGAGSQFTDTTSPSFSGLSSYGFAFDVNGTATIDALGLYAPLVPAWTSGSYTVTVWGYDFGKLPPSPAPGDFDLLSSVTFNAADLPTYPIVGGYAWIPIAPLTLTGTPGDTDVGFLIGAAGSFTSSPAGQLGFITTELPGATSSFLAPIFTEENAFSQNGVDSMYPVPFIFDTSVGPNGYFNPNLSYVPGPLPILGAGAGLAWSRKLRRRIKGSR